jgi:hypothetical protein
MLKKLIQEDFDLHLVDFQKHSFSELKYTINNIDINVILYLLAQEQHEIEETLIKQGIKDGLNGVDPNHQGSNISKTLRDIELKILAPEAKQRLRLLSIMSAEQIQRLVNKSSEFLKCNFKPLVAKAESYS